MAILRLIDAVSIGISLTGARTEPSISLVNTSSVGHATPDEMKDMSYLIVNET